MKYPYFRGLEADRYSFYRVPKALIKVDLFEKMSGDAKLLYAVLLDRMNLSLKNGWQDENGNAYIICTIDEIMDSIRCARQKAVKLLDELEHEYQLIERRRQGLGKPNLLYVKDLYAGLSQSNYWKYENQTSGGLKSELPGVWKSNGSKDYRITQDMAKKLCKLHHTAVSAAYHPQPFDWDALLGLLHKKAPRRSSYEAQLSDSDSLVTTTQIAKEYGCGAKVFNRLLHLHGIQYRVNGQWVLYSEHHGKGYTSSLTFRLQRSDGSEVEKLHTAWTQKGRKFLYHKLKRRGVLPLAEQGG